MKYIIIHCSDTATDMDIGRDEIDQWHRSPPFNFDEIGYHYVIRRDGTIEQGRPLDKKGAHAKGYNDCPGICMVGGRKNGEPDSNFTMNQYDSLIEVVTSLLLSGYKGHKIMGHCDLPGVTKTCPCFNVRAFFGGI